MWGDSNRADGGTLLLDDVDTLPASIQAKLLRALQQGEVSRLGGGKPKQVDVRVIATSNQDLEALVAQGRFREDLFYRLNVVPIRVPALRERKEDIPLLVSHFVEQEAQRIGREIQGVSETALRELVAHDWPGNVRELHNVVERAVVLCSTEVLTLPEPLNSRGDAYGSSTRPSPGGTLAAQLRAHKTRLIQEALSASDGNQRQARGDAGSASPEPQPHDQRSGDQCA